jgi:membrane protein DedA with SNARE-associated domain
LQRGGPGAIALGMTTPGVRAVTIAASGLANLRFGLFFPALLVGDSVFFLLHVAIGYAGGRGVSAISHGGLHTGPLLLGILVAVALAGLAGWLFLRRQARATRQADGEAGEAVGAWAQAGCPLCLALGALQERRAQALPVT